MLLDWLRILCLLQGYVDPLNRAPLKLTWTVMPCQCFAVQTNAAFVGGGASAFCTKMASPSM